MTTTTIARYSWYATAAMTIQRHDHHYNSQLLLVFHDGHPTTMHDHHHNCQVLLVCQDGRRLERRDPYAHQTDYDSAWCFVDDPIRFK